MFCTFTLAVAVVCAQCPIRLVFFWQFLNFVLSRYVAQLLSEWFWNGSSLPSYYRYHFCSHIPRLFCWSYFCLQKCIIIIIIIIIITILFWYFLTVHHSIDFSNYQLNAQFFYFSTIYTLHYVPQHVSSSTLLILRRTNCITTASGIVTLCKQP